MALLCAMHASADYTNLLSFVTQGLISTDHARSRHVLAHDLYSDLSDTQLQTLCIEHVALNVLSTLGSGDCMVSICLLLFGWTWIHQMWVLCALTGMQI